MKILTIGGARPQFIKAASISRAIQNYPDSNLKEIKVNNLLNSHLAPSIKVASLEREQGTGNGQQDSF